MLRRIVNRIKETVMSIVVRGAVGLTAAALAAFTLIGVLSEAHRAPDQP